MSDVHAKKRSGYLFMAAGAAFLVGAVIGKQFGLCAIGIVFIAIGAAYLRKAKGA